MVKRDDLQLLLEVSRLYYEDDQTQEMIAQSLSLSRPKVSRLLHQAREEGIVQISIHDPFATDDNLAGELVRTFELQAAVVVPAGLGSQPVLRRRLGLAAARYLEQTLRDGDVIGIGWGRTLHEVVGALEGRHRSIRLHVLPLIGGLGQVSPSFQVNELARRLATAFGGTWQCLYAPAILESQEALAVMTAQPDVKQIVEAWDSLRIALVGIGNTDFHSEVRVLFVDYVAPEAQRELGAAGAVGDLCVRFFDQSGRPCPPAVPAVLGIDLPRLRRIEHVIAVAGGADKVDAILGALRGGYVRALVTDAVAAQGILQRVIAGGQP